MTIRTLFKKSVFSLRKHDIPSPELDTEILLVHAVHQDKTFLLAHPEYRLSGKEQKIFLTSLTKRCTHIPIAYITGEKEFFKLPFFVNRSVLIPRPETELLVESALTWLQAHPHASRVADVGTGSACIAVSIAKSIPTLKEVIATDTSLKALAVARKNIARHHLSKKIRLKNTPLLKGVRTPVDCIIANLPYLSDEEYIDAIQNYPEIAYEPKKAHKGGKDGTRYIELLLASSKRHLKPHGAIFLEIGALQGNSVRTYAATFLNDSRVSLMTDYCGFNRVVCVET